MPQLQKENCSHGFFMNNFFNHRQYLHVSFKIYFFFKFKLMQQRCQFFLKFASFNQQIISWNLIKILIKMKKKLDGGCNELIYIFH